MANISQANMAHISQSRPNYGLDFQSKVLETFEVVPFLLGGFFGRARLRLESAVGPLWRC